jgi:NADPH2:quinone reductase
MCRGTYQYTHALPFSPGLEGAGVILRAGDGVDLEVGTRVIVSPDLPGGCLAQEVLSPAIFTYPIPDELDFVTASALHISYVTALLTLSRNAKLRAGETLLVHAGSGSLGSATIQVGRALGARVLATAGGPRKAAVCRNLGAEVVFDYLAADFVEGVLQATDGKGADVIYDIVGGETFHKSRRCIAFEGRLIVAGFTSGEIPNVRVNHPLLKAYSIVGAPAGVYRKRLPEYWRECHREVMQMYKRGEIDPLIGDVLRFADVLQAFDLLAKRESIGRIVVVRD